MVFHAKENIILSFFWKLKDHLFRFLKYGTSLANTKERSFYQPPGLKKISFYSQKSIISTFYLSKKFIIWTFPFVQSSYICKNVLLSFIETYVSLNHFKMPPQPSWWKQIRSWIKEFFTLWIFNSYIPILVASEIPWKRIWHFNFSETKTKVSVF